MKKKSSNKKFHNTTTNYKKVDIVIEECREMMENDVAFVATCPKAINNLDEYMDYLFENYKNLDLDLAEK